MVNVKSFNLGNVLGKRKFQKPENKNVWWGVCICTWDVGRWSCEIPSGSQNVLRYNTTLTRGLDKLSTSGVQRGTFAYFTWLFFIFSYFSSILPNFHLQFGPLGGHLTPRKLLFYYPWVHWTESIVWTFWQKFYKAVLNEWY